MKKYFKELLHHSYYMVGDKNSTDQIKNLLHEFHTIEIHGNPDFFHSFYENFTIDDARHIKELHIIKPVNEKFKKIFIISANNFTIEAQNALLKLLEEPADYAYFFLVIPFAHLLLPTIKSRLFFLDNRAEVVSKSISEEIHTFLKLSVVKRLEFIKNLSEDIAKEKKNKQDAINFLNDLELAIHSRKKLHDTKKVLSSIALARTYINDRAPSIKMLLESVALNLD